jgi:RHS repeat-associated protein
VYDAENRMTSAQDANGVWSYYSYNADGQRVRRKVNGVETWQVYGFGGELLAEYPAGVAPASPQKEYGYRNGQLLITADVTTGPPVPTFSDDFNDNSLDATKWSVVDPNSPVVVSEQSQQLCITLPPNTAAYNGVSSNSTYDLTGRSVQVEVAQPVSQGGWSENFIEVALDGNNYFLISVGSGSLVLRSMVGGVNNQSVLTFDGTAHHYWRIRHEQSGNTINFETSPDGTAWTARKTAAVGFALTSLRFYLYAGAWGTGNGSPGAAKYDNFQLVGNTPSTVVNLQWLVTDQLGTPRMVFEKTGALVTVKRHDYLPFGEELYANQGGRTTTQGYPASPNSNDGVRQKFTLKERDNETGLDYFGARYFASTQGRFTSVDPAGGDQVKPQTFNKYQYAQNNPLRYVDQTGAYEEDVHRDLTTMLAYAVGFTWSEATTIGQADQAVDEDERNPEQFDLDGPGYQARRDFHFTTSERRAELFQLFEVSAHGSDPNLKQYRWATKDGALGDLGTYMHALQDSFSHAGFGPRLGHLFAGHAPDKTFKDVLKANIMARESYDALAKALAAFHFSSANRIPWANIKSFVNRFNKAKSTKEKRAILNEMRGYIESKRLYESGRGFGCIFGQGYKSP